MRGDMTTFRPPGRHDPRSTWSNSIGLSARDHAVRSHLECVAGSLEPRRVISSSSVRRRAGGAGGLRSWSNGRAGLETP